MKLINASYFLNLHKSGTTVVPRCAVISTLVPFISPTPSIHLFLSSEVPSAQQMSAVVRAAYVTSSFFL